MADSNREANEDNPRGYYELEIVKRLKSEKQWVATATGKAVKVIAQLLPQLPPQFRYKIVFINRELGEVLRSQEKMLQRHEQVGADISNERLQTVFEKQLQRTRTWLAERPNVETLYLEHREIINKPTEMAACINTFLGGYLNVKAMTDVVKPALYRQRGHG